WVTAYVHQHSIRFKMDTRKKIVDLEAFREMLHISPRVLGQYFDKLLFEEEILYFLRFLGHSAQIKTLTDVNINKLFQPWRSFAAVINKCLTGKSSGFDSLRDDILFSTIKVVSRHQNTQQYGAILPIELTTEDIRNTKAYKEYYACATGEAAPKPKASARRKRGGSNSSTTPLTAVASPRPITTIAAALRLTAAAKGKQPARATSPIDPSEVERTEAEQLTIVLRRSRQETHISQHGGSSTDEGTGSKPGVLDVPSDDLEEEILWNSSDDEDVDDQDEAEKDNDDDNDDDEEEIAKLDEQEATESGEGDAEEIKSDEESVEEETREEEEESFDPIPRTPEDSENDGNGEEDHGLRVSEEQRLIKEEEADELCRDPRKPPTPDHDWNKTLPAVQGSAQAWISELAKQVDSRSSFNELLDTPIDFSNFIMNQLCVDTLTPELLARPTYELMRGSCNSLTELEYHLEEPLSLIPDNRGRRVIPFAHFINNDLEYLQGGASSQKYTTSVTKTKAADYEHIKWIEDLVPRTMWIQEPLNYDKSVLKDQSRLVPEEPSRSVLKELTRSVPEEPSSSVLKEQTRSVPQELSRS
nr:hypothetical protein [Tanacetum cinerariifolium]